MGSADKIRWAYIDIEIEADGDIVFNKVPSKTSQNTLYVPCSTDIYCSEYLQDDLVDFLKQERDWCNSNGLGLKHQSILWFIEDLSALAYNYISVASAGSQGIVNYVANIDTAYNSPGVSLVNNFSPYVSRDCVTTGSKHCSSFYLKILKCATGDIGTKLFSINSKGNTIVNFYDKYLLENWSSSIGSALASNTGYQYTSEQQRHTYQKSYTCLTTPEVSPIFSIEDTATTYNKTKLIPVNVAGKQLPQQPPFLYSKIADTGEVIATMDIAVPLSMLPTTFPQTYLIYRRDFALDRHAIVSSSGYPSIVTQASGNDGIITKYLSLGISYETTYTDRIPRFSESSSGPVEIRISDTRISTGYGGYDYSIGSYTHALRFFSDIWTSRYPAISNNQDIDISIYYQNTTQYNIFIYSLGLGISSIITTNNSYNSGYSKYTNQISMSTATSNPLAIAQGTSISVVFFRRSMHGRKLYKRGSTSNEYITIIRSGSGVYAYKKTNITNPVVIGDIFELRDTDVKEYMCSKGSKTSDVTGSCVGCEIPNYRHVYIVTSYISSNLYNICDLIPSNDEQTYGAGNLITQVSPGLCLNKMIDAKAINAIGYIVAITTYGAKTTAQLSPANTNGISQVIKIVGFVDGVPRLSPHFAQSINYMSTANATDVVTPDTNPLTDQFDGMYSFDSDVNIVYIAPI